MARICWDVLQVALFTVYLSEKTLCDKVLLPIWEMLLDGSNCNYNADKISGRFVFIRFLSCFWNQEQKSSFNQVGGLVTTNISIFCLQWLTLLSHTDLNRLLQRKLWHDIPVCSTISWISLGLGNVPFSVKIPRVKNLLLRIATLDVNLPYDGLFHPTEINYYLLPVCSLNFADIYVSIFKRSSSHCLLYLTRTKCIVKNLILRNKDLVTGFYV